MTSRSKQCPFSSCLCYTQRSQQTFRSKPCFDRSDTYRTMIVSPRKRPKTSMVAGLSVATELSSALDSSTIKRLGLDNWTRVGISNLYSILWRLAKDHSLSFDSVSSTHLFFGRKMAVAVSSALGLPTGTAAEGSGISAMFNR